MSSLTPAYKERVRKLDDSISASKTKISEKESRLIVSSKKLNNPYTTPIKPNTQRNDPPTVDTLTTEKDMEEFLKNSQDLKQLLEEKTKYIELQHEKDNLKWAQERQKFQQSIFNLNQKIDQKDQKIENLLQTVANLKAELKKMTEKCELQEKSIQQLSTQNQEYRQQNTQIKQQNKSLSADNKIIVSHLDKLLKEKRQYEQVSAQKVFQERERRVIESLYKKSMPELVYQQKPDLLPSDRNELSNKVKYENIREEYESYHKESTAMIRQLKEQLQIKKTEISVNENRIRQLQQKTDKLKEMRILDQSRHSQRANTIKKLQEQIQSLNTYNKSLLEYIESNKPIIGVNKLKKEQMGKIVTINKYIGEKTYESILQSEGLIRH